MLKKMFNQRLQINILWEFNTLGREELIDQPLDRPEVHKWEIDRERI